MWVPRLLPIAAVSLLSLVPFAPFASAQADIFSANVSLGSKGPQVLALQKILNRDPDTRIAASGPGSPGNETGYFGALTKAAVVRFQNKHAAEILAPVGLAGGNGFVGARTRAKLNALSASGAQEKAGKAAPAATSTSATMTPADPLAEYRIRDSGSFDIFAGDKKLAAMQEKISAAVNTTVASRGATPIAIPSFSPADIPEVSITSVTPATATAGSSVSISGAGLRPNSVIYLGRDYAVRSVSQNVAGALLFSVPPVPPGRYDLAVSSGNSLSNTVSFVVRGAQSQAVRIESVSPNPVRYGGTLTVIGSGFSPSNNVAVTNFGTTRDLPSSGSSLSLSIAPATYAEAAKIGNGTTNIPMTVQVVSDNGFSNTVSFDLAL